MLEEIWLDNALLPYPWEFGLGQNVLLETTEKYQLLFSRHGTFEAGRVYKLIVGSVARLVGYETNSTIN